MAGEWKEVALSELADIYDGPHATPTKAKSGPVFLGISNLARGRLDLSSSEHVSEADYVRWTRRVTPSSGDVVFSYETRLGEAALIPAGLRCCLGRRMGLLRAKPGKVDARFLLYAYLGPQFQEILRARTTPGSTVDRIPLIEMPGFPITVPESLTEQRSIARILGTLDDKIDLNRRMSESLEAMARALFKSWFVDFDPVRAKAKGRDTGMPKHLADLFPDSFENSELGEIPTGWKCGHVLDLCEAIYSGGTPNTQEPSYWGGGIPWLSSGETRAKFIVAAERQISAAGVDNSSTRLAPAWSTVVASAGQGNTRGQTSLLTFDSYVNQSVVVLRADPRRSSAYHLFFDLERRYGEFRRVSDGQSSRGSLTTKLLAGLSAVLPQREVICRFDDIAAAAVNRIVGCLHENHVLAALRDSLLPKLISGDVRVEDVSHFVNRVAGGSAS